MWVIGVIFGWMLIEITLFVTLGGWLGLGLTLAMVLGTAAMGVALIRWQGAHLGANLRANLAAARDPVAPVAHSALIGVAAVLLILPGFATDALGLLLLIPMVRRVLIARVALGARAAVFDGTRHGDVIDAQIVRDDAAGPPHQPPGDRPPSGWTRP